MTTCVLKKTKKMNNRKLKKANKKLKNMIQEKKDQIELMTDIQLLLKLRYRELVLEFQQLEDDAQKRMENKTIENNIGNENKSALSSKEID